jgi:Guanylyl transferase CofC like
VLYARPPNAIPFEFGSGSFERHYELATSRGLRVVVSRAPELTLDIDTPEDLDLLSVLVGPGSPSGDGDLGPVAKMLDHLTDHPAPICVSSQCR